MDNNIQNCRGMYYRYALAMCTNHYSYFSLVVF